MINKYYCTFFNKDNVAFDLAELTPLIEQKIGFTHTYKGVKYEITLVENSILYLKEIG